jgi:uncharacterized protein YyaL (SSP411 family)
MEFAQTMMPGAAGWPLNVILTPDLQPFFAATYLPPNAKHGLSGITDLVSRIKEIWSGEEREKIMEQAETIVEAFSTTLHTKGDGISERELIEDAAELIFRMADPVHGGIRGTPKFPIGYQWNFLLHYAAVKNDSRPLFLVERTLDMMHRGGIYDHLGGGFSRYSTDDKWLVPHFEKMLYDNAILAYTYVEAWQVTQNELYRLVAMETLNYILRDMTDKGGGFFSAEDADSEGREGLFYTWTEEEIKNILGPTESQLFLEFYGVTKEGNFEERNILHAPVPLQDFAAKKGMEASDLATLLNIQKQILWKVRERREHPFKDDKILTSWNGMAIFALAEAAVTFDHKPFQEAAVKAAAFIKDNLYIDGHLLRRWREGQALYHANLDDYAHLIRGLISLFETGQGSFWLKWALELTDIVESNFKADNGAFFQSDGKDQNILLRKCQFSDGAEPSGNAIHCENLLRLYQITYDEKYLKQAEDILKAVQKYLEHYPPSHTYHVLNLIRYYDKKATTVVVALNEHEDHRDEIMKLLYHEFIPHRTIIWNKANDPILKEILPFMSHQGPVNGKTTLYLCEKGGVCSEPITEFAEMIGAVNRL